MLDACAVTTQGIQKRLFTISCMQNADRQILTKFKGVSSNTLEIIANNCVQMWQTSPLSSIFKNGAFDPIYANADTIGQNFLTE
jgi:hypothetical protein